MEHNQHRRQQRTPKDEDMQIMFDSSELSGPWPECKGLPVKSCIDIVEVDAPDAKVVVAHPGEGVTREYNIRRVIVYVDENDVVQNEPRRG